jgi:hypothetical protein
MKNPGKLKIQRQQKLLKVERVLDKPQPSRVLTKGARINPNRTAMATMIIMLVSR